MTVKFDKEMLLKHRFWILVGVTTVMTMLGIVYLELYGSEEVDGQRKKLKVEVEKIKKEKGDKGQISVDGMAKYAAEAKENELKVWSTSYAQQEKYFRWSKPIETEFQFLKGKFAREIKISKKLDHIKDWPADTPSVAYGEFVQIEPSWLSIKKRNGEVEKFFAMATVLTSAEGQPRALRWGEIEKHGKNAMLAITFQNGKYFNDPLTEPEKQLFKDTYVAQVRQILESVDPLDTKGNGVVQLKNWLYDKEEEFDEKWNYRFLRIVNKPWELGKGEISSEAWIAQENLWIQKEIYRIIRSANDDIAIFKWDSGDKKKKAEDLKGAVAEKRDTVYRFKNSSFALELILQKDNQLSFTVKNLLPRKQKLDLNFRVLLNSEESRKPEIIRISDEPLLPAGAPGKKDTFTRTIAVARDVKDAAPRKGIYAVEQLLTWETAAIKRIDQVSIGSNAADDIGHSHRTFPDELRPYVLLDEPAADAPPVPKKGGPLGRPPVPPRGGGPGPGVGPVFAGGAGNKTILPHDLWTDRYVEVTEQSRRVPVAVALIVDQDHVDRVLTAFNNSKLRFLETQVLLNHYAGSLQPPMAVEKKDGFQPGMNPRFPSSPRFPGSGAPGRNPPPASAGDSESNMELVIYGIMTLYQRFPPRPMPVTEKKL